LRVIDPNGLEVSKKLKKKRTKKEKKLKKERKKRRSSQRRESSNPIPTSKKATVIVSKKIVRQATAQNQTLGQYIRANKLRLIDPSQEDLQKVKKNHPQAGISRKMYGVDPASTKNIGHFGMMEDSKYEEELRRQDPRVFAEPKKANIKRISTLEGRRIDDFDRKLAKGKIMRSDTPNSKVSRVKTARTTKSSAIVVEEEVEPFRKMSFNDLMLFIFLVVLTCFGVMLTVYEFSYYAKTY
jgi:hypothetical protein